MARVSLTISSVYVPSVINRFMFGQRVVIYFIMQLLSKKSKKNQPHLLVSEETRYPPSFFILSTATEITPLTDSSNIAATTMQLL